MMLNTETYQTQVHRWPSGGRVILAQFDADERFVHAAIICVPGVALGGKLDLQTLYAHREAVMRLDKNPHGPARPIVERKDDPCHRRDHGDARPYRANLRSKSKV